MAKNKQPVAKRCKALGIEPAVLGYNKKKTNRNNQNKMKKKQSEYGLQLVEKQKVKFIYGILEIKLTGLAKHHIVIGKHLDMVEGETSTHVDTEMGVFPFP